MANYKNIEVRSPKGLLGGNGADLELDITKTSEAILSASDWTQIPNSGLTDDCVTAFNTYRASIRTIRKTDPANPTWPDAPTEEWS
jgi:hypothetical protein|tara:strand:+ start:76 stop:333 length:258 start_codon:yes stop_codon:yes gene_type:complete